MLLLDIANDVDFICMLSVELYLAIFDRTLLREPMEFKTVRIKISIALRQLVTSTELVCIEWPVRISC
ncbi:hypothetical protein C497_16432 [Halalkalicoccus jeotgali B3]|uniref:Uncharacterized protein n=1 Tax=Halalkalicoccus jeotgali (strain DSM 18796 / CECT 7217 / JCM 14584 / KCTC 4019 / B3) TaxID=795797 RepID=D8J774_HALJB|nr:hypothetical protein HacjB3_02880 [Halalkalicoccus jeotgali B3]ELY33986.1 hypothetical protein C497_16432 [Halalkalicoccus jeotgali B3]